MLITFLFLINSNEVNRVYEEKFARCVQEMLAHNAFRQRNICIFLVAMVTSFY